MTSRSGIRMDCTDRGRPAQLNRRGVSAPVPHAKAPETLSRDPVSRLRYMNTGQVA